MELWNPTKDSTLNTVLFGVCAVQSVCCVSWGGDNGLLKRLAAPGWLGPQSGGFTGLLSSHPFRIVLIPVSSSPVLALPSLISVNTQPLGYKYNSHLQRKTIRNAKANSVPFERLSLQTMCFKTSFMQMMQLKKTQQIRIKRATGN